MNPGPAAGAVPALWEGAAQWLQSAGQVCRIEEVYDRPLPAAGLPPGRPPGQVAGVIAGYHQRLASGGGPLVLGWVRERARGPVSVLCATTPAADEYPAALLYPAGTRGRPVPGGQAAAVLEGFGWWAPVAGAVDALVPLLETRPPLPLGEGLEEGLLAAWHDPFAWLLAASPVPAADLHKQAAELAARERDARRPRDSPEHRVRAEQLDRRHREVRAGHSTGMWQVRLAAAGASRGDAAAVAGLLVAGTDLAGTPYALAPLPPVQGLGSVLRDDAAWEPEHGEHRFPFPASSHLVAALAHVPATEIPGIRLVQRPAFDVTPETGTGPGGVELGVVVDHDGLPAGPLLVGRASLNRHAFICGATGAGKSQTVRTLLENLSSLPDPVPWLVIEPAKAEYSRMAGRLVGRGEVLVIRPGELDAVPGCLNPLEPEPGFPLQTHIDLVRALFLAAFEAVEPFPQVLAHALSRCYRRLGWDVTLGEPRGEIRPRYPTLGDLRDTALQVVEEIGYGEEITADVRGFIDVRIGSLRLGTPGRFFEGGHPLDISQLMARNTVLELEDIGNDQDKAFFIGAILIRIAEYLRTRATERPTGQLSHVTVIEEAHRLLKRAERGTPAAHAVEMFASLLAEIRAYGEGIIVAEQIPSKITPDVLKNSAVKIVHRLPAHDDRQAVGATMNLTDEQSRHLVTLPPGRAAVFADGMDNAVLAVMPLREATEDARTARRNPEIDRRRSVACGTECSTQACTLRQIARAGHLAEEPEFTLWIEMLTMTHLVGQPAPQPDPTWLDALRSRAQNPRTLECAIAHRVQTAIDIRYTGLAVHYQPESLARHLADAATATLTGLSTCASPETRWQAGTFRWADVYDALLVASADDQPHPDTPLWYRRGLSLPGTTIGEQITALDRNPATWKPEPSVIRGAAEPTAFEVAASELDDSNELADRLIYASAFLNLQNTTWIQAALYPRIAPEEREAP